MFVLSRSGTPLRVTLLLALLALIPETVRGEFPHPRARHFRFLSGKSSAA